jgi:hypothetical protein
MADLLNMNERLHPVRNHCDIERVLLSLDRVYLSALPLLLGEIGRLSRHKNQNPRWDTMEAMNLPMCNGCLRKSPRPKTRARVSPSR